MKAYARTDTGKTRTMNQDSYYIPSGCERFAVVADGMGGHKAGDIASRLAVREFCSHVRWEHEPSESVLNAAISAANAVVYEEACRDQEKEGMGTTLTAIWTGRDMVHIAHVGDSRAYLFRNGVMMQITRDHSLVADMLEQGIITYKESLSHPMRHYITRAVGTGPNVEPDIMRIEYRPGDVWLLCSDGLSGQMTSYEMARIMRGQGDYQKKADELVKLALNRGGDDNITVLIVTDEEDG